MSTPADVDAVLLRADGLRELRRYAAAEAELRPALARFPDHPGLLIMLAVVILKDGRPGAARPVADAAVAAAPQEPGPHRVRAAVLSELGLYDQACDAAATAVRLAPQDSQTVVTHALTLHVAARRRDAYAAARHAVSLDPQNANAHLAVAEVASTLRYRRIARSAYHEALRLDPENAAARHDLAVLDLNSGRTRGALRGLLDVGAAAPDRGLPLIDNVAAVLWRLTWYVRLLTFAGCLGVMATTAAEPASYPTRIVAAAALVAIGGVLGLTLRRLPAQASTVLLAAVRSDVLLAITVVLQVLTTAVLVTALVSGAGAVGVLGWLLIAVQAVVALVARARSR